MKLVAVALLVFGVLCNSALAMAEGPGAVPFRALMQTAGAQPGIPPITDEKDKSTSIATKRPHPTRMTSGGKIMTGAGIGMLGIGVTVLSVTAALGNWAPAPKRDAAFATSGALLAGGATLVVFGHRRRSAE